MRNSREAALVAAWIDLRRQSGESYADVGKELGISRQAVWYIAHGKTGIGSDVERRFATIAYNGSIDLLRKDAEERGFWVAIAKQYGAK